jgi:hypothetical protein
MAKWRGIGLLAHLTRRCSRSVISPFSAPSQVTNVRCTGLGSIGVGWCQLVFAYQNNRTLILATIPMRLFFAIVMWNWGNSAVMGYEAGVAVVCVLTLLG